MIRQPRHSRCRDAEQDSPDANDAEQKIQVEALPAFGGNTRHRTPHTFKRGLYLYSQILEVRDGAVLTNVGDLIR